MDVEQEYGEEGTRDEEGTKGFSLSLSLSSSLAFFMSVLCVLYWDAVRWGCGCDGTCGMIDLLSPSNQPCPLHFAQGRDLFNRHNKE